MWPPPPGGTWVLDLDGVVWLAGRPIPGADEAVARLRGTGVRVLFATNNSAPTRVQLQRSLARCGITADEADLLSSADVAAAMLAPGSTALVVGEDGIVEALAAHGITVVPEGPADAVVVGLDRNFTYEALDRASAAVRAGARLVGTNEDATFPTPEGLVPGAGSLLAAVVTAGDATPEVAGKPHPPTAAAIVARAGKGEVRAVVGDRSSTDGALAAQLGVPFGLVFSGVTPPGSGPAGRAAASRAADGAADGVAEHAAATAADLRTLVDQALAATPRA